MEKTFWYILLMLRYFKVSILLSLLIMTDNGVVEIIKLEVLFYSNKGLAWASHTSTDNIKMLHVNCIFWSYVPFCKPFSGSVTFLLK